VFLLRCVWFERVGPVQLNLCVLLGLHVQVDAALLHGVTVSLDGGHLDGLGYTLRKDEKQEPFTILVPGGETGLALPVERQIFRSFTVQTVSAEEPDERTSNSVPLLPREAVPQRSKLRYKYRPIGSSRGEKIHKKMK
jgi:hypothetical protein